MLRGYVDGASFVGPWDDLVREGTLAYHEVRRGQSQKVVIGRADGLPLNPRNKVDIRVFLTDIKYFSPEGVKLCGVSLFENHPPPQQSPYTPRNRGLTYGLRDHFDRGGCLGGPTPAYSFDRHAATPAHYPYYYEGEEDM